MLKIEPEFAASLPGRNFLDRGGGHKELYFQKLLKM